MTAYKITATTATGSTIERNVVEATESKARKAFREVYRHGEDYTITNVEIVSENATATKQQERDALAKIKAIVETLGPQSYVATAFEGCFEAAEENIENDFGFSWKQRAESESEKLDKANAKIAALELDNRDLRLQIKHIKQVAACTEQQLKDKTLDPDDLADFKQLVENEAYDAEKEMKAAAHEIVTFAEEPDGTNFQEAVRTNRVAASRWNYLLGLKSRIEKALGAGA